MRTKLVIENSYGIEEELSSARYVILYGSEHPSSFYKPGTIVRLISGVDNNKTPGYHFMKDFFTVCREGAETAEYCGIKKKFLAKLAK